MESYEPERKHVTTKVVDGHAITATPLVFSATNDGSLLALVKAYLNYLNANPATSAADLAWTLQAKRNTFAFRKAFSGNSTNSLIAAMADAVRKIEETPTAVFGTHASFCPTARPPKILGVFTGQGAQWPRMYVLQSSTITANT